MSTGEWPGRIVESPSITYDVNSLLSETTNQAVYDPQSLQLFENYQFSNATQNSVGDHNFFALLILPILCVTGLIGNVMVCIAIWTDRRLHNVTNYFLFSLALADMLVCMVVMPLAILVEVKQGMWIWSFGLCLLYTYTDVFLCSASIVHISVISLDRYLGISRPLKLRNKSRTIVALKICFVWIMTIIISCPLAALAIFDPGTILQENICTIRSQQYMIYGSTLSFLIPFIIMTITFTKTTKLLNNQANALSQKSAESSNGSNGLRRTVMQHKKLLYTRTNSYSNVPTQSRTSSGKRATSNGVTIQMSPLVKYQSASADQATSDEKDLGIRRPYFNSASTDTEDDSTVDVKSTVSEKPTTEFQQLKNHLQRSSTRIRSQINRVRSRILLIARRKQEKLENTNAELANEHKATRVLAVVFACFFTCWAPFFVMNFTIGFCGDKCAVPQWLSSVILWLGYLSSTLNPVIYTTFNRRFRDAFLRIIRCQCLKSRDTNYSRSHVFLTGDATWTCMDKSALYYNNNRENSAFIVQNGSPKSQWINFSMNRRQFADNKNRVRAIMSTSSSGSSKALQSVENLSKKSEIPGILLSKPLNSSSKAGSKSNRSLEDLPHENKRLLNNNNSMDLYPYTQMFPPNRRFSAAGSIFPFESKLSKSQKNNLLRSTPVLTVSNYDEEQIQKGCNNSDRSYYDQKTSFTPAEIYANIDDDIEESEYDSLLAPNITDRSQTSILPFPYYN